ncbi:putative DNA-binding protein [Triangularia verruculosa]|uniref:DNA-binding protein n=1 Tax=Triangularia verruculosa TaxID=2587418 RepID=A0AAN6XVV5_9PEZI|nr:putative DNA-binding protein [Triangularia verruculosa]
MFGNMSSAHKRACYKCGELGHQADGCPAPARLCYNYRTDHESNECPLPRTTKSKQCYHCQGVGHVQAECPTMRLNGGPGGPHTRCYTCGQPNHIARNCPTAQGGMAPGPMPGRGGFGHGRGGFHPGGARHATCYKCGGPNHYARDCQAQAMKCYACGKLGHISRDCTAPNGGPLNTAGKTCYQCGEAGHISRDCPKRNGANGADAPEVDLGNPQVAQAPTPGAPLA